MPQGHHLIADEPEYAGGTQRGAAPIDLMAAALASCKAVTLRMQADRHGWPLEAATVHVTHRRLSARAAGEGQRGSVNLIDCRVVLQGEALTEQQQRKLLKLSAGCWVEHALKHGARVQTHLAAADPDGG